MLRPRTHILYIAEFSTGGSVESLLCLVGGLDQQEFEATVLFYRAPNRAICERFELAGASVLSLYARDSDKGIREEQRHFNMQAKVRKIFGQRIEHHYASLKFALRFLRFRLSIYRAIRRKIERIQPDLVHLNGGVVSDTPGLWAVRACDIPTICHVRTFGELTYLSSAAARSVSVFLCISNAVQDWLTGYGIEPGRCVVVPNAVDPDRFNESAISQAEIRKEFGWDSSDKVFALVGRVVSWKGQDFFIEAIAEARKTNASIRGLIVGDGDSTTAGGAYVARLRSLVNDLNLDDSLKFTGHRTDIPNIMKSADAVICASSLPEPFGRVIIESMAVGTPAVATNAGGATDIITDGVNGILVPMKDSDALAHAMLRLSRDTDFAQKIRSAAMQTVADRYTVKRHAEHICTIYRSVLESQKE